MVNAKIMEDYPLSNYVLPEKRFSKEAFEIATELILIFTGKKTTTKFFAGRNEESLKKLIEFADKRNIGPAPREFTVQFKQKLSTLLTNVSGDSQEITDYVAEQLYGYKLIQPLLEDDNLEEIMINGINKPILVFHTMAGTCKTDIQFSNHHDLEDFMLQLGTTSEGSTFTDSKLIDGSRVNVVNPPASTDPVITLRKYRQQRLSIIDLINSGTMSVDAAAMLWVAIDGMQFYPFNILICGSTASGKTTLLNSLGAFIPPSERIISMEDTRELDLGARENWVSLTSSTGTDLADLVKNCLRMRPDRIIVGEVRGEEAQSLFTSMNVGQRGALCTLHANSPRDGVNRLMRTPMNVPADWIPLADLIVSITRFYDRRKGLIRRISAISEVSKVEEIVALNDLFKYNAETDTLIRSDLPSQTRDRLARATSQSGEKIDKEIANRKKLLEYMIQNKVQAPEKVDSFMAQYYSAANDK